MDPRGVLVANGPGWPPHLAKDSQFMQLMAVQQNQHTGH